MSALRNPVIGLLTLHMSKPSQHATTNNTIHTLDTQPTPELFTFSSVLQGHSRHPSNHTILRSHKPSHIYIFPFTFNEAHFAVNNPLKSLNFPQAHLTLPLDASFAPPPFPITSPK